MFAIVMHWIAIVAIVLGIAIGGALFSEHRFVTECEETGGSYSSTAIVDGWVGTCHY